VLFQTLRVVVGTEFGPRSAVWRIWTQKNEVYVAPRSLGGEIKTSLHASGSGDVLYGHRSIAIRSCW
jgi:hypothetical protein